MPGRATTGMLDGMLDGMHGMELRVFTEPQQGASYDDLLRLARAAEGAGYGAFFRSDHYLRMGGGDGLPGPTDSWVTLAALARETSTIRLGTLMSSATFRLPGILAIQVAQVDQMSGGRVELGIGAGWFEREHTAYGIPFPARRFDRLEEQLAILTGLWSTPVGETFSHVGEHYTLTDCPALPKPVQRPSPPVIIGGHGPVRTPSLAARYAAEFNVAFDSVDVVRTQYERLERACAEVGRDSGDVVRSVALVLCCGRDDAEVARRAAAIGRDQAELRADGLAGTPAEVVQRLGEYAAVGVTRCYLQVLDLADLDHVELVAAEVAPQLRG